MNNKERALDCFREKKLKIKTISGHREITTDDIQVGIPERSKTHECDERCWSAPDEEGYTVHVGDNETKPVDKNKDTEYSIPTKA